MWYSIDRLKRGEDREQLPEIFLLESVIENNPWHDHQSVLAHTIAVMEEAQRLALGEGLPGALGARVAAYFHDAVESYTKGDILQIASLCHDTGKALTVSANPKGFTSSKGHEALSIGLTKRILTRFDVTGDAAERITVIVAYHGMIHEVAEQLETSERAKEVKAVVNGAMGFILPDLIIHGLADTYGGTIVRTNPVLVRRRQEVMVDWLEEVLKAK